MAFISLKQINKAYEIGHVHQQVLNNVSLQVDKGEMLAIVGASGSGKSTLMNILGLLDTPDSGEYELSGQLMSKLNPNELAHIRNQHIGFVFQQFHLLTRFTALQNVCLPLLYRDMPATQAKQLALEALNKVQMESYSHHKPNQLSGGQQQRVAIARAIVSNPSLLLADEPTGALDSQTSGQVMDVFRQLNEEGRTLIIITHDESIANQCLNKLTISDGQIKQVSKYEN